MIAFTNHALDHMLRSVLEADITRKIARLGSRSKDDRVSQFSLETLERVSDISVLKQVSNSHFKDLKSVEEDIKKLLNNFSKSYLSVEDIMNYLDISYPEHWESLCEPDSWIVAIFSLMSRDDGQGAWRTAGTKGQGEVENNTLWTFWRDGRDLEFLRKPDPTKKHVKDELAPSPPTNIIARSSQNTFSVLQPVAIPVSKGDEDEDKDEEDGPLPPEKSWQDFLDTDDLESVDSDSHTSDLIQVESESDRNNGNQLSDEFLPTPLPDSGILNPADLRVEDFFALMDYRAVPVIPSTDRPLDELLTEGEMWSFSIKERRKLVSYWTDKLEIDFRETSLKEFERLRNRHAEILRRHTDATNEACFYSLCIHAV
jgi:hypothetical protein